MGAVSIVERLRQVEFFRQWPSEALDVLASGSLSFRKRRGDMIIRQGQVLAGLYVIRSGHVLLYFDNAFGQRYSRRVSQSNWLVGFLSVFDGLGQPHAYKAVGPVEGILIRREILVAVLNRWPDLWFDVTRKMAEHHRIVLDDLEQLALRSVKSRLVHCLISNANRDENGSLCTRLTQEEIASVVGVSRQSVSAILRRLSSAGFIRIGYRRVILLDRTSLLALGSTHST